MSRLAIHPPTPTPAGSPARWLAAAILVAVAMAACGPASTASPAATGSPTPSDSAPTSPIEGVITHVVSAGLDQVTAFTIRTDDGLLIDFRIGTLENGDEFPPGHLTEHQAASDPVRVYFTVEGEELVAIRLEDAGG